MIQFGYDLHSRHIVLYHYASIVLVALYSFQMIGGNALNCETTYIVLDWVL